MSCAHAPYNCKRKNKTILLDNHTHRLLVAPNYNALVTHLEMDKDLLYKYISGQTSEQEEKTIVDWLDANPDNQKELNTLWAMQEAIIANIPYKHHTRLHLPLKRPKWYRTRFIRICTQAAAVLLLVAGSWYASRTVIIEDTAKQYLSVAAPAGQRIDITLQDGTVVCLNSGAKLEYPVRFNKNRRVKLSGEAMFNVEHDATHPFIVETFACDVEVLGTKFNVTANEQTHDFATALLRGKVKVTNKLACDDQIILDPNEKVCLNGNRLVLTKIENTDDYLWTEGILNLVGHSFIDIIAKMGKTYGVKIEVETMGSPQIDVIRGKIPVNMGLDYALRTLQEITPFEYEKDENNIIHIK